MSSPLDRIKAAEKAIERWVREQMSPLSTPESRWDARNEGRAALTALVNVAKAAEYAEDELRKYGTGVHLIGARHRVYDALALNTPVVEPLDLGGLGDDEQVAAIIDRRAALQDTPADSDDRVLAELEERERNRTDPPDSQEDKT